VRRSEQTASPAGYGPRDHICWVYRGDEAWRAVVVPFLRDGVSGHDRLLYVADKPEAALVDDLAGLPERDALLASGQLEVRALDEVYGRPDGTFDGPGQVARFEALAHAAVADGYRSLRLAADVTGLVPPDDAGADRVVAYELLVDAMGARSPWTSLCGYDRARIGERAARALSFVHPVHHDEEDVVLARLHAAEAGQWCLQGEVDIATHEPLATALATLPEGRPVHLDVIEVDHIDVGGLRALTELAARRAAVGGLVLHRPSDVMTWMLDRWGRVRGLEVRS
jgi:ABC-type transporter Mla MlaB component